MHDAEKKRFRDGMEFLRQRYGLFGTTDELEWRRKLASYWDQLRKYDWEDVRVALTRASEPDFYPERFPTAGQLERVVITCRNDRADLMRKNGNAAAEASEDARARERLADVPIGAEDQAEYIAAATDPGERLAREFECESKRLGLEPNRHTPSGVRQQRMQKIYALLDGFASWPERSRRRPESAHAG